MHIIRMLYQNSSHKKTCPTQGHNVTLITITIILLPIYIYIGEFVICYIVHLIISLTLSVHTSQYL